MNIAKLFFSSRMNMNVCVKYVLSRNDIYH